MFVVRTNPCTAWGSSSLPAFKSVGRRFSRSNFIARSDVATMTVTEPSVATGDYDAQWEGHWKSGVKVNEKWDKGTSAPALKELLKDEGVATQGKAVLVPGCGRGYDLVEFIKSGADRAIGFEISTTAAETANGYLDTCGLSEKERSGVNVEHHDFFSGPLNGEKFDVGYDYTFFCAIHPSMRGDWGRAWAEHIKSGGKLVALCYPDNPSKKDGPPWHVHPDDYIANLTPAGFEVTSVTKLPDHLSFPDRAGHEHLAIFTRM